MKQVDPVTQVCIHEAGHAVMMRLCKMQIKYVRVNHKNAEKQKGCQGICVPVAGETEGILMAKVVVAGVCAESIMFGLTPVRRLNRLSDADDLEVIMTLADVGVRHRAKERRRVINMVTRSLKKHWDKVQAIADELKCKEKISGKVVNEIMMRKI